MLYGVRVPYCGYAYVEVEAASEEEAIEQAFDREDLFDRLEEGEFHESICEGNIFHGVLNEVEVEELEDCIEDDDEDETN